jgi:hypothetical protein
MMESTIPPACSPTMERLQLMLDGDLSAAALDSDAHVVACAACRERIAAARLLLSGLKAECVVPSGLTDSILGALREDRLAQVRRRSYAIAGGVAVALAASLLLFGWLNRSPNNPDTRPETPNHREQAKTPPAPEPRPVRLGDEFAKVGQALIDTSKPIVEPAAGAPQMFAKISDSLTRPAGPVGEFEPARTALAELPYAARAGFEPVTSTTQKAFDRLLRDIGSVQVSSKPKS